MVKFDIYCQDAVTFSENCCVTYKEREKIYIGNYYQCNYKTFLYFNLPTILDPSKLIRARLILSKVPIDSHENTSLSLYCNCEYNIIQFLDFFNDNICNYDRPNMDNCKTISFYNKKRAGTLDTEITSMVQAWLYNEIENNGMLLSGNTYSELISFASNNYKTKIMRPIIRITYKDNIYDNLKCIPSSISLNN